MPRRRRRGRFVIVRINTGRPADPAQIILLTLAINYVQGVEDAFGKMQEGHSNGMVEYNQLQIDDLC